MPLQRQPLKPPLLLSSMEMRMKRRRSRFTYKARKLNLEMKMRLSFISKRQRFIDLEMESGKREVMAIVSYWEARTIEFDSFSDRRRLLKSLLTLLLRNFLFVSSRRWMVRIMLSYGHVLTILMELLQQRSLESDSRMQLKLLNLRQLGKRPKNSTRKQRTAIKTWYLLLLLKTLRRFSTILMRMFIMKTLMINHNEFITSTSFHSIATIDGFIHLSFGFEWSCKHFPQAHFFLIWSLFCELL